MAAPDLSNVRALIADDRAEVRDLLASTLRQAGLTRIDTVSPADASVHLLGLAVADAMAADDEPRSQESLAEFVSRFTHDVGSPLTTALLHSRLLAAGASDRVPEDARTLQTCVEEIASLVLTLARRAAAARPRAAKPS
jgi:signal transduction histidine kinase